MRILHILGYAERGGCEKNCYYFIESTSEYDHEIVVLNGYGPMVEEWSSLGVNVNVLEILRSNLFSFSRKLNARLSRRQFDKIILWTTIRMPVVLNALNVFGESEIYVHVGNPVQPNTIDRCKNVLLNKLLPVRNQVNLRPVSSFVQQSLSCDVYFRRFSNRVSLKPIANTCVRTKFPEIIDHQSAVKLGMVARLDPIKDHETVIRAFAKVLEIYPYAVLELVGDGPMLESLTDLSVSLRIADRVKFLGEAENVYSMMKSWDLFLYGTTYGEGLGGTIPEALSIGLPVVAVDLPMIREWDSEGAFIEFCAPADPDDMAVRIVAMLENVSRRKFIHEQAPDYISMNFSPQVFSSNYMA